MKAFCRISLATLPLISGLFLLFCNDDGRTPAPAAKPGNSQNTEVPVVDTLWETREENNLIQYIDPIDRQLIDSLLGLPRLPKSFLNRVDEISRYFMGVPFDSTGPTGEGRFDTVDTMPIYNIRHFDCLTYVEHVLALALSSNADEFISQLQRLRYKDGKIDYLHRNHFFVIDWLANNKDLATLIAPKEAVAVTRIISKKNFFSRKGLPVQIPDTNISIQAWSVEGFTSELKVQSIPPGIYIIAFIKKRLRSVIVNHVGFALITPHSCLLRDANKTRRRVSETSLVKYLDHNAPILEGVLLVSINHLSAGLTDTPLVRKDEKSRVPE
ncbi:MAG TPA: N-acetylmuramoyl-L-alanine amidase-like domain-containing protein [Chitinispirillaceae bacterium]|nr:N-acetylmuramoyl-L-alanine amidase-like domain-containing protein [Chitinispirillaceae bacterium]